MNRRGVIRRLAMQKDVSERQIVEDAINASSTVEEAARRLGITATALHVWLRNNGYRTFARLVLIKRDLIEEMGLRAQK